MSAESAERGTLRRPRTPAEARAIAELVALARRHEAERVRAGEGDGNLDNWVPLAEDVAEDSYSEESAP